MALLSLHTEKGSATVNASNDVGLSIVTADGSELKPSIIKGEATLSTGNVRISPTVGTYTVTPEAAISITFDATAIGDNNAQFSLILDMTDGTQTVRFPEDFNWNGDAPGMNAKGTYAIDVMRISVGEVNGYIGNYAGSVTKAPSIQVRREGEEELFYSSDYCEAVGQGMVSMGESNTMLVLPGGYVGTISYDDINELFSGTELFVSVRGGEVGCVELANPMNYSGGGYSGIEVYDGFVGTISIYLSSSGESEFINVHGGTVSSVYIEQNASPYYGNLFSIDGGLCGVLSASSNAGASISGGTVSTIALDYQAYFVLTMTGGVVGSITMSSIYGEEPKAGLTVTGGTIGEIRTREAEWCCEGTTFTGCTIGYLQLYMGINGETSLGGSGGNSIGANAVIDRLDFTGELEPALPYTLKVGANSVVKLAASAQQMVSGGYLKISADPTATVINL